MTTNLKTESSIKQTLIAMLPRYAIGSFHHAYGGIVYGSMTRLREPLFAGIVLLITLGMLWWYQRTRSKVALTLFVVVAILFWVGGGLLDGLYGHAYKDILFLAGVPRETAEMIHPSLLGEELIYPPDNILFEVTGLLNAIAAYLPALLIYRLLRNGTIHPTNHTERRNPVKTDRA